MNTKDLAVFDVGINKMSVASAWLNFRSRWMASRVSHAPYKRLRDFSIVRICAIRTAGGWEARKRGLCDALLWVAYVRDELCCC